MTCFMYSCGDGSFGEPHRRGDGHCENMNLLLGKKERVSKELFNYLISFRF